MEQGNGQTFAVPCELVMLPDEGGELGCQLSNAGHILYLAVHSACTVSPLSKRNLQYPGGNAL